MKTLLAISISIIVMGGSIFAQSTPAPAATGSAEVKPPKTTSFRPVKDQIMKGQAMLKEQKLYSGDTTGKYDDATRDAVKSFQKANSLEENGKFDRATLAKMNIALTEKQLGGSGKRGPATKARTLKSSSTEMAKSTDGPKRPAPFRASDDQITMAQKMLRDGKMLTGGEDGKLDDATRDALGKYQEANSLKVTKTLNSMTLEKMGIALTEKQKQQVAAQSAYDAAKAPKN